MSEIRIINRTAVHEHALRCSKALRAGKFTRVGEAFFDEVEADVERLVREVINKYPVDNFVEPSPTTNFATGYLVDKTREVLDMVIAKMIQRKVRAHPSCGCTLQNTY